MLFNTILLATSVAITSAFVPAIETGSRAGTYLQSSALIIQNKGGGHAELVSSSLLWVLEFRFL